MFNFAWFIKVVFRFKSLLSVDDDYYLYWHRLFVSLFFFMNKMTVWGLILSINYHRSKCPYLYDQPILIGYYLLSSSKRHYMKNKEILSPTSGQ